MKNQKGFSLIELLVVVIIIGIIAAIAIPSLLASRRAAQESSAVSALRTVSSANATYQATIGGGSNYASLADLNAANGLIDSVLGGARKGVYSFTMSGPTDGTPATSYCVEATPDDATTYRSYAISDEGVIYVNDTNLPGGTAPTCDTNNDVTGGQVLDEVTAPAPPTTP